MRSKVQDSARQEKNDRWLDSGGVTRKHEAGKGTARRTGTGSPTEMEKKAAWREEERQQKEEEGAGQGPKMKNGEQEGDAKQKTCSMTGKKKRGRDPDEER